MEKLSTVRVVYPVKQCGERVPHGFIIRCATPEECAKAAQHFQESSGIPGYYWPSTSGKPEMNLCKGAFDPTGCELRRTIAHELWHFCGGGHGRQPGVDFQKVEDLACKHPAPVLGGGF